MAIEHLDEQEARTPDGGEQDELDTPSEHVAGTTRCGRT
jgi:hypothetical protein